MPTHCGRKLAELASSSGGQDAILEGTLIMVNIINQEIEGLHSLLEARLRTAPLFGRDNPGNYVEWPCPINGIAFGIDCKSDTHCLDSSFRRRFVRR